MTESSRHRSNSRTAHRGVRSRGLAEVTHDDSPAHWFPVWAPALVMLAIVFTGLVLANGDRTIPTLFFGLFAVGMIASTIFVEPRGLFITVASFPLFYLFGSLLIGWFSSGKATIASRKTKVITSIYPAIEHYLWLLIPFLIAVGIAVFRWWSFRESLTRKAAKLEMQRRRRSESDRSNIEAYGRAQERSHARSHARRSARSFNDAPSYEPAFPGAGIRFLPPIRSAPPGAWIGIPTGASIGTRNSCALERPPAPTTPVLAPSGSPEALRSYARTLSAAGSPSRSGACPPSATSTTSANS